MESADMTPLSPEDARLEKLLSQDLNASLPDDGFSARVLAALPPPQRDPSPVWGRITALTAGALAGLAVALWQGAHWSDLRSVATQLGQATSPISDQLTDTGLVLVLAITAGSLALAFFSDDPAEMEL
jgi:hypothetical protein